MSSNGGRNIVHIDNIRIGDPGPSAKINIKLPANFCKEEECHHRWIVTTDKNNFPEDVMCVDCKEVVIMVDMEGE